ncbi:hypothetical protein BRPE64_DCDS05190 (plasmid) [Caballeronia insecticola]|uniref:Uncharacterized protein n=1 Tax=Caballeronia insecticola TaxID=758793 RepID=R4X026_9BURK|nr:hypothetical protein BRPE64_DCDS05190 [Caballeronia insecticola]
MVPALSYAQSKTSDVPSETQSVTHSTAYYDRASHGDQAYGSSSEGTIQSGWITQPSAQALRQSLYIHH